MKKEYQRCGNCRWLKECRLFGNVKLSTWCIRWEGLSEEAPQ